MPEKLDRGLLVGSVRPGFRLLASVASVFLVTGCGVLGGPENGITSYFECRADDTFAPCIQVVPRSETDTVVLESVVESDTEVRITLRALDDTGNDELIQPLVRLEQPLDGRKVIDGFTGEAVPER